MFLSALERIIPFLIFLVIVFIIVYIIHRIYRHFHNQKIDKMKREFDYLLHSIYRGMPKREFLRLFRNIKYKDKGKIVIFDFTRVNSTTESSGKYYEFYFDRKKCLYDYQVFRRTVTKKYQYY